MSATVASRPATPTGATSFAPSSARLGHLPSLDGVRGLAILLVLLYHGTDQAVPVPQAGLAGLVVAKAVGYGWAGVDLFFVLSGFLITSILLASRGAADYYRTFFKRRALRIAPLYFAVLAAVVWVMPRLTSHGAAASAYVAQHQAWYWLFASNLLIALGGSMAIPMAFTWSLAVEEQFYAVWPSIVARCTQRALARVVVGGIVGATLLRLALWAAGVSGAPAYVLPLTRADALLAGAGLALALRSGRLTDRARRALSVAGIVGLAVIVVRIAWAPSSVATLFAQVVSYTCNAAIALACVASAIPRASGAATWAVRVWSSAALRFFGRYSYGLYLLHAFLLSPVRAAWTRLARPTPLVAALCLAGFVALAVALALVSWRVLERPALRLAHRRSVAEQSPRPDAPALVDGRPAELAIAVE